MQDLTHLLRVGPLNFLAVTIDIKDQVTHYLDTTFYNLNTVALHDWKVIFLYRDSSFHLT